MDNWLPIIIAVVVAIFIIGNFSTLHKNSSTPLRKKGLNDLEETLPRSNKDKPQDKPSFTSKNHHQTTKKNSD